MAMLLPPHYAVFEGSLVPNKNASISVADTLANRYIITETEQF